MTKSAPPRNPSESNTANVLLFPLCDTRGLLSTALQQCSHPSSVSQISSRAHCKSRADNIFFAWLLDLPASVDPAAAARAILLVADSTVPNTLKSVSSDNSDGDRFDFNDRLQHLLQTVIDDTPLYHADDLDSVLDEIRFSDIATDVATEIAADFVAEDCADRPAPD